LRRIELINKINTYAARFVLEVEGFTAINQYHINIHAESFLIPILNNIFDLNLENLNATQRKNFPAVDLADFTNRVAFQITSTATLEKIKDTLDKFTRHNLIEHFDSLYFYIITERNDKYSQDKIKDKIPDGLQFDVDNHILDKDRILQKINNISATPKLELLCKLFEHEFSDVQIDLRKKKFEKGYLVNEPEEIFPNFLEISFPDKFYTAEVGINEEEISERINTYLESIGKKRKKKFRKEKLIRNVLREVKFFGSDWLLHDGRLFTFRDLNSPEEPLRKVVNVGTIEPVESEHFAQVSEDSNRVFKYLLRETFIELCHTKSIEFFRKRKIFRFANNPKMPKQKKLKWKGKKEATKTVIFEMINKKEKHIICFRSLAFRASFDSFDSKWYVVVNPTWSFTNPGGYHPSRFESGYMSGLKRMENNNSIYNYFRFFGYYLSYVDLFTTDYPYIKVTQAKSFAFSPSIDEKIWNPVKLPEKKVNKDVEDDLGTDTELDENLF